MKLTKWAYGLVGIRGQATLDRLRYKGGMFPRVGGRGASSFSWLSPHPATLLISADLELGWAWRYARADSDPLGLALRRARRTRENMPVLLRLFDRFKVPVTWATVGHLFLESCGPWKGPAHPEVARLPYFENEHWRYGTGDWFDADPGSDCRRDPAWYAPDLVRAILEARVKHEIACHSFSHIDFSDGVCPPDVADGELRRCRQLGEEWGLGLNSFVFPGNLVGNLASLKRHGFVAYRWHYGYDLDVPRRDELGLWRIPGGVCWERPKGWPVDAWIGALRRCVDRAVETRTVLHLWFHPSCETLNVERVFPAVLDYVVHHQGDLRVMTMGQLVEATS